eukprot:2927201-Rhodomonas_salina.1
MSGTDIAYGAISLCCARPCPVLTLPVVLYYEGEKVVLSHAVLGTEIVYLATLGTELGQIVLAREAREYGTREGGGTELPTLCMVPRDAWNQARLNGAKEGSAGEKRRPRRLHLKRRCLLYTSPSPRDRG